VIISPYVAPGSKIRPTPNATDGITYPFDHTSIIATVRELFLKGTPQLTSRDGKAPHLLSALSLAVPTNDGPPSIDSSLIQPLPSEVKDRADASPNGMQRSLSAAAATLPEIPPATAADIPSPTAMPLVQYPTVAIAHANATAATNRFLGV
jgi:phospholipase C